MLKKTYLIIATTLFISSISHSQSLVLDPNFDTGLGIESNFALATAVQDDDKIVIGGAFNAFNGNLAKSIVRLNPDGSIDNSFNTGTAFSTGRVKAIAIQNDGKILCGGRFNEYNEIDIGDKIVRLNPDGSIDNTFDTGTGFDEVVETIVILPDGKLFVGGDFTTYKGISVDGIAKINEDGTLDTSFDTNPAGFINTPKVDKIAIQSDGKIIAGGLFDEYDNNPVGNIVRFNTNGTVDNSFNTGAGFDDWVEAIKIQNDGKILLGGRFEEFDGTPVNRLIRLNTDGSIDHSFNIGTGFNYTTNSITIQDDGKILVGGWFDSYNEESSSKLVRLNSDGTIDPSFNIGTGFDSTVETITILDDKTTLVCGWFEEYNGTPVGRIARLMTGPLDLNKEHLTTINMYPNPASNKLQIATEKGQTELHIFDLNGKSVYSKYLNKNNEVITLNNFTNGIYSVMFINENTVSYKKLVINK